MRNEDDLPYTELELDPATDAYTGETRKLREDDEVPLYVRLEQEQRFKWPGCSGCVGCLLLLFCVWIILAFLGAVISAILT